LLERILIVDPGAACDVEVLAESLAEEGIQLVSARSAVQAVARLEATCFRSWPGSSRASRSS